MSTPTPDQGITLPQGTDLANVVLAMQNAIANIETRLNLRYLSVADRTARHPAGIKGESSDVAAENWADSFDGTTWISRSARGYRAMKILNADATAINNGTTGAAFVNDPTLFAPLESAGSFAFGGFLFYDSPTTADMKMTFTWPGAPTASRWGATGRDPATATNLAQAVIIASGGAGAAFAGLGVGVPSWVQFEGFIRNTGAAGNLQLQYAQNAADPGNFTVRAGSRLWVLKTS